MPHYTQQERWPSSCAHSLILLDKIQLNSEEENCLIKPVLVNTLSWPRSEVVTIPKELWERLSANEQSSMKTQRSKEGENLGENNTMRCTPED